MLTESATCPTQTEATDISPEEKKRLNELNDIDDASTRIYESLLSFHFAFHVRNLLNIPHTDETRIDPEYRILNLERARGTFHAFWVQGCK